MADDGLKRWKRFRKLLWSSSRLGISLDISRMPVDEAWFRQMQEPIDDAFRAMDRLEGGAIANPDEGRMVGHYWLRAPEKAPTPELRGEIRRTLDDVAAFARAVHRKELAPPAAARFTDVLLVGIGGSALGPQLVADALGTRRDKLAIRFLDNTDPDGIARQLESLRTRLKSTLVLVISKSGTTPETRNGMLETRAAFQAAGLDFPKHAVAITGVDSKLDQQAVSEGWLRRFPMWDWVGGRTSVMSAVGLVPAALQGLDIERFLEGAAEMDEITRQHDHRKNPAARLALMWHLATGGKGEKDMVILPYKDRLVLFSRYLQQLVMESLGKEKDLDGNVVHQGIAVYGNKGSTDQHAYVQQLREGVPNFFATFVNVLQDYTFRPKAPAVEVDDGVTSGDYLNGFWQGTREALHENGRGSITITIEKLDARTLGAMIALYERAVGLYASLVNINAYHQPGVEAGKKAAAAVLDLQKKVLSHLKANPGTTFSPEALAEAIGETERTEAVYHLLEHLAANRRHARRVRREYQHAG